MKNKQKAKQLEKAIPPSIGKTYINIEEKKSSK
jgi:hypothetical protein